jgi:CspA family cold shock protein
VDEGETRTVIATVLEWREEEGWGVVRSADFPDDIFVHFSVIEMDGYKFLQPGQHVEVKAGDPVVPVEGCRYAAVTARPLD